MNRPQVTAAGAEAIVPGMARKPLKAPPAADWVVYQTRLSVPADEGRHLGAAKHRGDPAGGDVETGRPGRGLRVATGSTREMRSLPAPLLVLT